MENVSQHSGQFIFEMMELSESLTISSYKEHKNHIIHV
jgi:hypothetical protein